MIKDIIKSERPRERLLEVGEKSLSNEELIDFIGQHTDERIYALGEALRKGITIDELYFLTKIDRFFLYVGEHFNRYLAHFRLSVTVSSRRVTVNRTKVSVTVNKSISH